jgi:oxygen-independent coproporphyrinogen III oxidase
MLQEQIRRLTEKYNRPIPRYTSYPTVPFWKQDIDIDQWKQLLTQQFGLHNSREGISLYIHLPFCESLCTYCGCNKKITSNHSVEEEYLAMIEQEFELYLELFHQKPVIRELHLGGGTPTFFSPANLERLIHFITDRSVVHPNHEFSIEGHPNNTTYQHLEVLYKLGFRRISYGVQDNDPEVQRVINRIQPLKNVQRATEYARAIGFESVNYDLIYGLPKQTLESVTRTINEIIELRPDRIAFYSYAHVPWTSKGQRLFDENDLPLAEEKLQLYLKGKELLIAAGYTDIGMDHFALPTDDLFLAWECGKLHRNFMGYTTQQTSMLLGLGVSSISDIGIGFVQNEKSIHEYYEAIHCKKLPLFKGYFLNEEDKAFRNYILNISCKGLTTFRKEDMQLIKKYVLPQLQQPLQDELILLDEDVLVVTEPGRQFIRNICSAFDLYLQRENVTPMFSKAI